jgi:nicotinate-nucleotide adenylyltransferase
MASLGILGGTFNPPHLGHLVMGQEALDQLDLDRVVLMPVSEPPHKEAEDDPGAEARVELCRLAVAGDERFEVSTLEVDRGGASYTIDTLRELHASTPEHELTFIVGGDMAYSLPSWREPAAVLALARLAVAEREELRRHDIAARLAPLAPPERIRFFDMPRIDHPAPRGRQPADPVPGAGRRRNRDRIAIPIPTSSGEACRMTMSPDRLATIIAAHAADKKARDIVALDLRQIAGYTDFFVICTGNTDRQTKAIHDGIHLGLKQEDGLLPRRVEGLAEARWILMDYLDVVVHVFTPETRDFYRLEALWGDVPRREFDPQELPPVAGAGRAAS